MRPVLTRLPMIAIRANLRSFSGLLMGVVLAIGVIGYYGFPGVVSALTMIGVGGMVLLVLAHIPSLLLCGLAWGSLVPHWGRRWWRFLIARWIRDAGSSLLPVIPVSGELLGVRVLCNHGLRNGVALASTVMDLTVELIAQFLFTVIVLIMLIMMRPADPAIRWIVVGLLLCTPVLAVFVGVQNAGLSPVIGHLVIRLAAPLLHVFPKIDLPRIRRFIRTCYGDRKRITMACLLHLAAWFVGTLEVWLALRLLASPRSFDEIIVLEGLVFALRAAAFVVPGGLGVQEGAYVAVGALFGLSPDIALAISLLKRARELVLGIPGLCFWQWHEALRLNDRDNELADRGEKRLEGLD